MGSCDQGRIKLSTQFLNFSVTVNHLCLEQCFLFTSKQLPVDRLNISLSTLQYSQTGIQTWAASERDALCPSSLSHKLDALSIKPSFPDINQQTWSKDPRRRGLLPFPSFRLELTSSSPCIEWARLISSTRGCRQPLGALPRSQPCRTSWRGDGKARGAVLVRGSGLRSCLLQVLCWRYPSSCLHWAALINSTPRRELEEDRGRLKLKRSTVDVIMAL